MKRTEDVVHAGTSNSFPTTNKERKERKKEGTEDERKGGREIGELKFNKTLFNLEYQNYHFYFDMYSNYLF